MPLTLGIPRGAAGQSPAPAAGRPRGGEFVFVIINEQAARLYWPHENPAGGKIHLGVRLVRGVPSGFKTIVGIVWRRKVRRPGAAAVALTAAYVPARRAATLEPIAALRAD